MWEIEHLKVTPMAKAIKAFLDSVGGKVTAEQIKQAINTQYPGQWRNSTLQAHLYACVAYNPKAYIAWQSDAG